MDQTINRGAPTFGVALTYFIIMMWAIPHGYIGEPHAVEAVAMGSVIVTNIIMETRSLLGWVGAFFVRGK